MDPQEEMRRSVTEMKNLLGIIGQGMPGEFI